MMHAESSRVTVVWLDDEHTTHGREMGIQAIALELSALSYSWIGGN